MTASHRELQTAKETETSGPPKKQDMQRNSDSKDDEAFFALPRLQRVSLVSWFASSVSHGGSTRKDSKFQPGAGNEDWGKTPKIPDDGNIPLRL